MTRRAGLERLRSTARVPAVADASATFLVRMKEFLRR
jgi:hypothetical protein